MRTTEGDHDWEKARELFLDLVELEPAARRGRLEAIGADDPSLRARVERLLANDRGGGPASDPPSRRFGPYETVRPIAEGGMGEVHLARRVDGEFELQVAVKLLKPHLGGEELVARFHRERQTLAQLDHAYITRLLDGGRTPDGTPYLVMEYVDGRPLDRYCEERGLGLDERLELFQRVLSAVVHAHERGVIHRDLKPNNILVRDDGAPRLLDFGISRPADPTSTPGGPLTRTGHRLFTPEYAAPEQVRGAEVDQATDVFALGVLLYQLLTGDKPWRVGDGGLHELEMAILEQDPLPPSRLESGTARRAIAGNLDTITLKCLAKDPRERYAGALDLAADLDLHRRGLPIRARRLHPLVRVARQARRHPFAVAAGIALLVAAAAAAYGVRQHGAAERRRVELVASIEAQVDL
ncbi:MAG: serine/threonine-protein kinase, partial [Planctomycetota bacterium JB042]